MRHRYIVTYIFFCSLLYPHVLRTCSLLLPPCDSSTFNVQSIISDFLPLPSRFPRTTSLRQRVASAVRPNSNTALFHLDLQDKRVSLRTSSPRAVSRNTRVRAWVDVLARARSIPDYVKCCAATVTWCDVALTPTWRIHNCSITLKKIDISFKKNIMQIKIESVRNYKRCL